MNLNEIKRSLENQDFHRLFIDETDYILNLDFSQYEYYINIAVIFYNI